MVQLLQLASIVLSQTEQEKKLTFLYIGLFIIFLLMMVLDSQLTKKYTNASLKKVVIALFIIVLAIFTILYFFI